MHCSPPTCLPSRILSSSLLPWFLTLWAATWPISPALVLPSPTSHSCDLGKCKCRCKCPMASWKRTGQQLSPLQVGSAMTCSASASLSPTPNPGTKQVPSQRPLSLEGQLSSTGWGGGAVGKEMPHSTSLSLVEPWHITYSFLRRSHGRSEEEPSSWWARCMYALSGGVGPQGVHEGWCYACQKHNTK